MKKFLVRVERAAIKIALKPEFRPEERKVAVALAKSILVRAGASSAAVAVAVELIDRFVK